MMKLLFSTYLIILLSTYVSAQNNWVYKAEVDRSFVKNEGQFDSRNWQSDNTIEYAVAENPFYIFFSKKGLTYRFDKIIRNPNRDKTDPTSPKRTNISELIHVEWVGANNNVEIISEGKVNQSYSYAIKDFSTQEVSNLSNVKGYKKITYKNLYNNIDVEYLFQADGRLKYNIILHPGADPSLLKMKYSTSHTNVQNENTTLFLNQQGQFIVQSSIGEIIEEKPSTFYFDSKKAINSSFKFQNNILTFDVSNYDNTKKVIIDPWLVNSTYTTSSAVWEVETDGAGNVYTIGGETPMELKKFNAAGVLQWTYVTPWDTSTVWLGTLATDDAGVSYITSGTTPEIERIDNAGNMVWHNSNSGFGVEYWSITFNCDKTKLIVGGTKSSNPFSFPIDFEATIYDIDINNGSVQSSVVVGTSSFGISDPFVTPVEVRSISSSKNAKYIFLTHEDVGAINENLSSCPNILPTFQVDNQDNLGYKCENYLPETQNGGGLKALVANDTYFYTHSGDQIRQWDLANGNLINTVTIVGGVSNTVPLTGGSYVENSGLAVDDCGNVYAGTTNSVVKYDQNLNVLSTSATTFTVYDVSVNSNGEVLAVGAQSDNSATNRNGRIESIAMSSCAQYSLVCCDASFCEPAPLCDSDAAITLTANTAGGTWSSVPATAGLNSSTGVFDPVVAGAGTYTVTYTLVCGTETHDVVVNSCTALSVCQESNGDLTVTGGTGPYAWQSQSTFTDCSGCFGGSCVPFVCDGVQSPNWTDTGVTVADPGAGLYPIEVTDNNGTTLVISSAGSLTSCSATCTPPTLSDTQVDVTCLGGADGSIDLTITGTSTYDVLWSNTATTEDISGLTAGTYSVTVTDQVDGTCTANTSVTIIDGGQPTVVANATFTTICSGDPVTLTGSGANSYVWTGIITPTDGVPFNPTATDTYTVTGTDGNGCTNTDQITITVNNCSVPTASFTASNTTLCENDCISFTDQSTGTNITTWAWSFPGATTSTSSLQNPTNICYPTAGTYDVTLTVTDANGTDDSTIVSYITVNNCAQPTASFTASNTTLCENDCISFTDQSTGTNITTWAWSFPGATTSSSSLQNPTNICYPTAGTYDVTLIVTDANGTDDSTIISYITVNNCTQPTASFTASNTTLCENDCISFTDQSTGTNISAWAWSFPGAITTSSSAQNPSSICYPTAGTYAVTLTVTDDNGTDDSTMTNYITVTNCSTPTADFSASSTTICQGDCIDFTDLSSGTVGAVIYSWSFPGSTTSSSSSQNPTNICYPSPGNYSVTLSITDNNGTDVSTMTNYITVTNCTTPTANFSMSEDEICLGECVDFTDLSTGGATSWQWSFPGGFPSSSTDQNPTDICFMNDGTVTITLIASNSVGGDTITQTITVNPLPTVDAGPDVTINSGVSVTLDAIGSNDVITYLWSPSTDLSCVTCSTTVANPELTTTYIVTVTDANGCSTFDDVTVNTIFNEAIGVPSAFSPNGDDWNDILYVEGAGINELEFRVYNRYGQLVFESNDKSYGWDGTFNGKPENPGVFAYVAVYTLVSGESGVLKGDVTLIK